MIVKMSSLALADIKKRDNYSQKFFIMHIEKMSVQYSHKHLKYDCPYFVDKVTNQCRIIFNLCDDTIIILRCFKNHKDYENYYKSFK
jgi:hypothetical protein